jgi:hypothetical protein
MPEPLTPEEARKRATFGLQMWRVVSGVLALVGLWGLISELNRDEVVGPYGSYGGPDTNSIFLAVILLLVGCAGVWKTSQALARLDD